MLLRFIHGHHHHHHHHQQSRKNNILKQFLLLLMVLPGTYPIRNAGFLGREHALDPH
jgi:hypothetical protein